MFKNTVVLLETFFFASSYYYPSSRHGTKRHRNARKNDLQVGKTIKNKPLTGYGLISSVNIKYMNIFFFWLYATSFTKETFRCKSKT